MAVFEQRMYEDPAELIKFQGDRMANTAVTESLVGMTPYGKLMAIWASWISLKDRIEPGGWDNLQDTKDFMRTGEAVETMVNGLPRHQWWAIRKSRGICTVWIFPNLDLASALQTAEEILTPKMKLNADTYKYFR